MPLSKILSTGFLLLTLAACGGGGGDSPAATLTVTPALGKVQGATINLRTLQGTLIGSGHLGSEGSVRLGAGGNLADGFIVELVGGSGAYYFDEGIGSVRPLASGQVLRAISAGPRTSVTVSALTDLAYWRAVALANGGAITADHVAQAESEMRSFFSMGAGGSLLDVPELVDDPLDLPDTDTWAGLYASRLAAWATFALARRLQDEPDCLSDASCAPLPGLVALMASDFADGSVDGHAGAVALPDSPYAGAGGYADGLFHTEFFEAHDAFRARVAAVRAALPGTDRLIGDSLAGNYALSCSRSLPTTSGAVPASVSVAADGGMRLRSGFGSFSLPAGASFATFAQAPDAGYLFAGRSGQVVPASLFNTGSSPTADGLSIVITPPDVGIGGDIILPGSVPPAPYAAIMLSTEASRIVVQGAQWECTTIAGGSSARVTTAERLASWLPAGDYRCEVDGNPEQARFATVGSGTLAVQAADYAPVGSYAYQAARMSGTSFGLSTMLIDLAGYYPYALESVDNPLGFRLLADLGHTHDEDDIAATLYPRSSLLLAVPPLADDGSATESLRVYRSLVTGKGYFDFTTDGLALRHCQRVEYSSGGNTSSGGGLTATFGSTLTVSAVSLQDDGYGIYGVYGLSSYLNPHGGTTATCYGSTSYC